MTFLVAYMQKVKIYVRQGEHRTDFLEAKIGVRQGNALSSNLCKVLRLARLFG